MNLNHLFYGLLALYSSILTPTLILFLSRRRHEPIKSRSWGLTLISTLWGWACFTLLCVGYAGRDAAHQVSCSLLLWPSMFFIPFYGVPFLLRGYHLYLRYHLATWQAGRGTSPEVEIELPPAPPSDLPPGFAASPSYSFRPFPLSLSSLRRRQRRFLTFRYTLGAYLLLAFLVFSPSLFVHFLADKREEVLEYALLRDCMGPLLFVIIFEGAFMVSSAVFLIFLLFPVRDTFFIRKELALAVVFSTPLLVLWAVAELLPSDLNPFPVWFPGGYFTFFFITEVNFLSLVYPIYLTYKEESKPLFPDIREVNIDELFELVLTNQLLLESYKEFAIRSFCIGLPPLLLLFSPPPLSIPSSNPENILFYLEVQDYVLVSDKEKRQQQALQICKKFLQRTSPMEINIDHGALENVNERIGEGDFSTHLFDQCQKFLSLSLSLSLSFFSLFFLA